MTQPIELQPEHYREIQAHGVRAFPHECCGFMLGRKEDGVARTESVRPAVNERGEEELHNRFTITPRAFMKAQKAAKADGLELLGFYHSHPNAPARPSQYDLDHAWPVYSYVIVSIRDGEPEAMTSWLLQDDRSKFNEQTIIVSPEKENP